EEAAANNASSAPHKSDAAKVQIPSLIFRRLPQQHVALGVGNHFRAVKRPPHILDKSIAILIRAMLWTAEDLGSSHPLVFHCGKTTGIDGFHNQRDRKPKFE